MSNPPHEGMSAHATAPEPFERSADGTATDNDAAFYSDCIQRTASALLESEGATNAEIEAAIRHSDTARAQGRHFDLIELIARVQGHDEEFMGDAVLQLGDRVAGTLVTPPVLVPFASKLIAPNAFYESFPQLHQTCRELLCPVIYAEDSDAIGTASINPVAAIMIAEHIARTVKKRLGIRPFVSTARMDYESWCFLTRKHFEL